MTLINEEINFYHTMNSVSNEKYSKLKDGLNAIRYVLKIAKPKSFDNIHEIAIELLNNIINLLSEKMITEIDIENTLYSGVIVELLDLLIILEKTKMRNMIIMIIYTICRSGTPKHTHIMFEMNIFNYLIPIFRN